MKAKKLLSVFLAAAVAVFGSSGALAASYDEEDERNQRILSLRYDDISAEVENASTDLSALEGAISGINSTIATLNGMLDSVKDDPIQTAAIQSNITLLNISRQNLQSSLSQAESAQDQMVISVETLFISYNSLEDQRDELRRSLTVIDANLRAAELQNQLGMMTDHDLAVAKQNRFTVTNSISMLDDQLRLMGNSINVMIGRVYDAPLRIMELPELTEDEDLDINHRRDMEDAIAVYNASSDMALEQFKVSYESMYRDVEQKERLLELEEENLVLAQQTFDEQKARYDLGMLSELGLITAQDALDTQKASVKTAETNLFTSVKMYWHAVKDGIIVSS